ncbi:MAG: hypothetical protein SGJ20_18670, partial [Planctomycetota bacterium]|nr:hypothetical protein [Planctomycetota bacterium]
MIRALDSANAPSARQLETNLADKDLSDLIAAAERTMRRAGAEAGYLQALEIIAARGQRTNDLAVAMTDFWSDSSDNEAGALAALAATHNTPLNHFLKDRADEFHSALPGLTTDYLDHINELSTLATTAQEEVAVVGRDAEYDMADRDRDHLVTHAASSQVLADLVAFKTAQLVTTIAPANVKLVTQSAKAERDYAIQIAEAKRTLELGGTQNDYNAHLQTAAEARTAALEQARSGYAKYELSSTHALRTSLAQAVRDQALAMLAEDLDWSNDTAQISHDLATTIAEERFDLLTDSSLVPHPYLILGYSRFNFVRAWSI